MRKRFLHGAGLVLLVISATLVIWQGSFSLGNYGPTSPEQTFLYWAVSTLAFLLTVTLGFILFRTGLKLYIERQSSREGSRIKTKLVVGVLALTFLPVFFLVLFGVSILNYNMARWFSRPAAHIEMNLHQIAGILGQEARERATIRAEWLAGLPEADALADEPVAGGLERFCREREIPAAVFLDTEGRWVRACGPDALARALPGAASTLRVPVHSGDRLLGYIGVDASPRIDITEKQAEIQNHIREYQKLAHNRTSFRNFYLLLLLLITLFILFFATWIALFFAKQISNPISALLNAATEVRKGNLGYRVQVKATDELATLVRAFNEMTRALEVNGRELERRRRFTEAILESIPTGVLSLSSDGSIQKVNPALSKILPPEKVAAATRLEDLFARDDTAEIKYMMKRARRTGMASRQLELKTERGTLHLAATVSALDDKLTSGFVLVLEDTSELLRAQKAAAWQEVARRVAHEIKNPLTPIGLCGERIARQLDRVEAPPDVSRILRECAATIANEVQSVKALVNEFSQLSGFPTAQPALSDLNEVIESALGAFDGRLEGMELRKDLAPGLPQVNIDREQFKRVLVNLVDNAAEAMQDSPLRILYVATQAGPGEIVELIVADTGCGISPEEKDRLFLPYFSTKGRGTGLGLAIVNHILAEHNASIRVEDNEPAGARFIIEIPSMAIEPEPRAAEARI
jgi:PAS domain S-box-containing protein